MVAAIAPLAPTSIVGTDVGYLRPQLTVADRVGAPYSMSPDPRIPTIPCASVLHLRRVFLLAPSAPAVQIFIPAMRALDRRHLICEIRQGLAARCRGGNRDDEPARSVLTQPPFVDFAQHHLLRRPDVDVA